MTTHDAAQSCATHSNEDVNTVAVHQAVTWFRQEWFRIRNREEALQRYRSTLTPACAHAFDAEVEGMELPPQRFRRDALVQDNKTGRVYIVLRATELGNWEEYRYLIASYNPKTQRTHTRPIHKWQGELSSYEAEES